MQNTDAVTDSEIEQLQALIAAGEDPTASLPDTAAGGTQGNEGTSGFVSLARSGAETLAASGYDSAGFETDAITLQEGLSQNAFNLAQVAPSTVTLLAPTQVNEGGSITYTAVVDNAPLESDLILTLSNGASITIAAGQTEGTVTVDAPTDDVYQDGETLSVNVTGAEGGNYEELDLGNSVDTTVNDTIDTTTITLTAPAEVSEGGSITYTATVNNAPETDLVLTLSNGASITIAAGQTEGTVTVDAPTDDVYQDGETLSVNVTGAEGGNYEELDLGNSVDTTVNDTIDTTTITLTAPAEVSEGGSITYTATVNNAPETDLVLTLSNGASITIAAGQTEGTVTVDAPTDDVYQDGETLSVNVTGAEGGNYEDLDLGNSVDTQVNDTIDTTTITLTAPAEVSEGGSITYTATVNNAPETDLVLTLSNGASITIAAGQTEGTVTVDAPTDDVYQDGETLSVNVTGAEGGNYEDLDLGNSVDTQVNDTIDTTTITLTAPAEVSEGGSITYTATVNNAPETDLILTLSNGASITIAAGQTEGTVTVDAPTDDVYQDGETLSVNVTGAEGGNYEELDLGNSVDTQVNDTIDTTTITLTAPAEVSEGGSITYTATVNNAPETDLILTLSNGASITIAAGQTEGTVTVDAPTDDVYQDGETLSVNVTGAEGGNYEDLDLGNSVDTQVNDTIDTTTITLTAPAEVSEGGSITYTATVNNAPETDLVLTLSNGASITIAAGQTEGTVTVDAPTDDVYQDGETLSVNVTGAEGGNYEDLDLGNSVDTQVNDTIDTTTITLTAPAEVSEGGSITYTATVNNAPETDLVLTLSNGASITIAAGQTEGTVTVDAPTDDVYQDGETLSVNVTGAEGGNYEELDLGNSVDTQVNDTIDTTTITLTAPAEVSEGGSITYTATVNNAPETDLILTLSNGASITIAAGQTEGTVTVDAPTDDVYQDGETLSVNVTGAEGGNYEDLDLGNSVDTQVNDTIDTTTITLTAPAEVSEGGSITYTATVNNAPETDLILTLSNGASITIAAGQTEGTVTVDAPTDDVYQDGETLSVNVTGAEGGNYEELDLGNSVDTQVNDTIDTTTITLTAPAEVSEGGSITYTATVNNAPETDLILTLSNGASITIAAGQTEGTVTVDAPTDDVYQDGETLSVNVTGAEGGNYEDLDLGNSVDTQVNDTIDTTTITLTAPAEVSEGGSITYTATVNNAPETDLILTLSNGASITIAAGQTEGTVTVDAPTDDVYQDGETLSVNVTGAEGGNYEELDLGNSVDTQVNDTIDTTTITLTAPAEVSEGGSITYTATVNNAPETDLILTLSNGASITIAAGQTEGTVTVDAPTDDVYQDGETLSVNVTGAEGGNYEDLDLGNSVDTQVNDTIDTTTITLTAPAEVSEGGSITYTATVNNAPETDLVLTLSNGASITIAAGQTEGTVTVDAPTDDVYQDGETLSVNVTGAEGGNYEELDLGNSVDTTVNDTIDTTTITLTAPAEVSEGGSITYTATVNNAPETDLVLTLSNGASITIAAGQTEGTVTVDAPTDDVYQDGETLSVNVTGAEGGNYEDLDLGNSVDTQVNDTIDTTTITLTAPAEVSEGGSITYTATVNNAPETDLVLTLSNGASITIAAGQTEGTVTVDAPTDDVYQDGETLSVNVTGAEGGNYEELDLGNSVDTQVNDTIDTTTITLTAPAEVSEGGSITYTATVNNAPETDLVLTLSNGASITIAAGQTEGTVTVDAPTDDVYQDGETLSVNVTGAEGGNYEDLDLGNSVDTTVNDTIDTTTITLTAPAEVSEGGSITYTATVNNAPETDLVLTLSNGASITIAAGQTEGTVTVDAPTDDVFVDAETLTVSIDNAQGGNFENLDTSDTASTLVNDTTDTVFAQISVDKSSVTEGGEITYTVTLVDANGNPVTLPSGASVSVALDWSGTASAADVDNLPPSVTITGDSQQSFTVNTINDGVYENSENLSVVISGVTDVDNSLEQLEIGSNNSADTTILDAQDAPVVRSVTGDSVIEGNANTFTVTLSTPSATNTEVTLSLSDGSAIVGTDTGLTYMVSFDGGTTYTAVTGNTVTVPPGATSFLVQVDTIDDTIFEGDENYSLNATANGAGDSGTAQITDNDSAPTVSSITGDTVVEGTANTFDVNLSNTASSATTLTLTLAGNSATKGVDFSDTEVTVTINGTAQTVSVNADGTFEVTVPANTDSFTVQVNTTDDTIFESTEDYTLSGTGANGTVTGTAHITDNDSAPTVSSITGDTVVEGTANTFDVNLSNTASSATTLTLTLAGNSATKGVDFSDTEVTVTINGTAQTVSVNADGTFEVTVPANTDSFTVQVNTTDDTIFESTEDYTLSGTGANGTVTGTAHITDNDSAPTVSSITGDTVVEGTANTFDVNLSNTASSATTLTLTLAGNSATKGVDFSDTEVTVTINGTAQTVSVNADGTFEVTVPANTDSFTVQVNTTDDTIFESTEDYTLSGTGANGTVTGTAQITDNDSAPTVSSITGDTVIEGTANTFDVNLSNTASSATTLTLTLAGNSATKGVDFSGTEVTVTINGTAQTVSVNEDGTFEVTVPANTDSFTVRVNTTDDTIFESTEDYTLSGTGANGTVTGTAQITDNDSAPTVSSITGDTVIEGTANTFDVNLSNTASSATTLTLTLAGNSATKGVDFSGTEVTVTINGTAQTVSVNEDGTFEVTVPANIDSFTVRVNTTDDTIFESTEDYTLSGTGANGTVTGTAHITDNDSAPTVSSITGDTVIEGTANTFDVNLSNTASSATTLTLTLAGNSATKGVDFSDTEVTVTINGTAQTVSVNADGTFEVTVPANTDSFTVQVNTTDDTIFESTEDYTLSGTGANGTVTGTAQITDNDSAPTVSSITGDTVVEGTANTFDVNLSNTASSATTLTLTLAGNSATKGVDFSDTEVTVTINGTPQTVSVNADGTFEVTVPANTDSFTVQVNTSDDTIFETTEDYTLSGTGANGTVTGTAQITDNDSAPTVSSVTGDTVVEGNANTFTVSLSNPSATNTEVTLSLSNGSAIVGTDTGLTYMVSFDGGTTYTAVTGNTVTVPAGATSFLVQVDTIDDTIFEGDEDYSLNATANGTGDSGTGTITDNDSAPTVSSITGDTVVEGTANTFDVNLSNTASSATTLTLTLAGNSATKGVDFSDTEVTVTINGTPQTVSVNADGTFEVTVPANTDSFTVQVNTSDDTIFETTEDYTLSGTGANGTVTGTAQITDNDSAPTVSSVTGDTVVEGNANTFTVSLSNPSATNTEVTLSLSNGSAIVGTDTGLTYMVSFDGGTTYTAVTGNTVTVPAGATSFLVQVDTIDDTIFEGDEDYSLNATANGTGDSGTGTITDNDSAPTVSSITGDTVVEGTANTFDVNLSNTASSATTLTLTLAGNSATKGVDFSDTEVTVTINGTPQTVSVNADGTFEVTVPANTDSFTVQVNTSDDTIFESTEDYTLSGTGANGTVTGTAQITDNDSAPTVSSITGDTVVEGTANTFDVNLSNTASSATTLTLTLAGNSATKGVDFSDTEVTVTINGTAQTVSVNADGTFEVTVPANTDSFTVQVNTTDDTIFESTEDYTLSGTGANGTVTGTAQITDNDSAPTVSSITGDTVVEGTANTFDVNLSNTASSATTLTLTLAGNSATKGVDFSDTEVTVTINGTAQTVSVNADGTFEVTVPANTDSFTVQVNTTDDTIFESTEDYTLSGTGANGTVTGTAQITDNDSAPTVSSITGDTVVEGTANTFDVNLSNTASSATTLTLTLAGNSATKGVDFSDTEVTVTINGTAQTVSVNADGTFEVTVPANTDSFTVQVNTTDDTIFESTEDYTLSGTGANGTVTGTAQITDNDSAPTVSSITGDTVVEGTANTFDVNLSNTASSATTLTLTLAGNSATKGVDFSDTEVTVTINGTAQTVSVNADGTFEVTVPANTDSFTVQVNTTDDTIFESTEDYTLSGTGANGTVTGTAQITDNDILGGDSINLSLQDADTVGDNHDTDSSFLTFTASGAADIIDFTFGPTSGITVSGLDGNITWIVDSSSGDLVGSIDGTPMIVLSLNGGVIGSGQTGNVSVTATLLDNLQHGSVPVDIDSINITGIVINAVDSLNNSASGTVNLTVADDEVVLIAGPLNGTNAPDTYIGTLDTSGVDQAYTSDLSGNVNGWDAGSQTYFGASDITAGGKTVFFFVDPNNPDQLFAYTSDESPATAYDASNPDQTLIFTLSTDPNSDSYQLDILQSIDKLKEIDIGALVGGKGGISGTVYVTYDNVTGAYDIYNDPSKVPSDAEVAFTLYGRDGNGNLVDVNGTNNGFGVANPWVSGEEVLVVDYAETVASASFNFNVGNNDPEQIHYKAYDANGQLLGEGEIGPNEVISDLGAIAYIELSAISGTDFQLTGTTAQEIVSSTESLDLDFGVVVTDSDGDQATGNLDIHLDAPGGAPVAIISHALASLDEFGLQDDNLDTDQQSLRFKAGDSELSDFGFNYQNGDFSGITIEGIRENFPLSWRLEGEYLIASMPGNGPNKDVLKISLDWSAITAGSEGNIIVNAELIGNLPHSIDVDSLKISGIEIVGTDNNNQTAVSTLDVKVEKYTAAVDDYQEINEGQLASGNIFDNDTGEFNNGQDLELASFTVVGDSQVYSAGDEVSVEGGTLVINLNGSYTFTPEANWNGTAPVITYVTNNGDTATLTIKVNSVNDAPTIVTTTNAVVSEEGLTNGLPDSNGSSDTTDNATANGTIQLQDVDGDALTVSLTPPSGITSGGQTITWQWDAATHTLTGSVGNLAVMSVVLTPPAGNGSGDWDYQVKLLGPIDHPDTSIEDVKDLTFGVSVNDGNGGTVSGSFVVSVEDDAPYMPDTAPVTATVTDIPDTLLGVFDLTGDTDDTGQLNFDGFTITARGFTSSTDHTLTSANINSSSSGIGVASVGSPYHNIANEVDFREFADGTGISEEIIIDLDPNTLAFGMKIEFANIFKGELESGVAEFWRDGQLISSQTFSSDKNNGDYAADFNVQDGGFDTVVIKATDNGKAPSHGDNSDFTIKSLEFIGTGDAPAIAYASGEVTAQWGADGQGSLALAGMTDTSLWTAGGEAVEVTLSGNTLLGQTDSGDLVFKLEFTPGTGHWDFYQYQTMQGTEDGDLDFTVTVTDADGDSYSGNISVVPVVNYQVTEAGSGDQTLDLGNAEDIVIGDLDGTVVVPGQDYNIAFMVDSSGSIGYWAMKAMKLQLTQVFETLKASADSDNAGTVNIFLTDFDFQANLSVSVDLGDPDALSKLQTVIDSMDGSNWTGGGTNYEDVIKTTANWFHSDTALANSNAENLAFFITDGAPYVYQANEKTNPIVNRVTGETLDDLVNVNNFTLGEAFYANIGGEARLIIDASGNLYQWSQKGSGRWGRKDIGDIRAQGDGTYEISTTASSEFGHTALQNALSALPLLTGNDVIVQAIGIGSYISTDTLKRFDSDGAVQTNVSADELAEAILGNEITDMPGSDNLDGGTGNDIIFGDVIRFDGIQGQGYSALKAFIAGELGQSDATDAEIHNFISEHPNLFDKSGINDMGDIIRGGEGSDILFGQGGNDELYGGNGNDMLFGGNGNDLLFGGNGNDLLVGGNGDDWLTGGQGVDTFSWKAGETGTDHITDFELNKDKLDLSELLLLGEEHNSLEQYFEFSVADGNTTISIDADLDGEFDQHIVLDGVDLFAEYGSDESDIINGLLGSNGDGPLLVDTQSANPGASYVSQSSSSGLDQPKPDEVF
ncbi:type I secretion C-terminal target domain-containing protein [Shewanella chilikensis]|nr:type I secretion C-terminal target domain-containing protein [Shewanella chilikensis]